jgi:glycosyltransferase involved in cell wall biosynthesis
LPRSYWEWKGKAGEYPSYSIIIPSHNTAPYVTATLQSVADSIKYFNNHGGNKVMPSDASCLSRQGFVADPSLQFRAEVVVVDDASTDNTVARVMAFMEQQKRLNVSSTT